MIFIYLEYPSFQAFIRLIQINLRKLGLLDNHITSNLIELATYHGISKDDAHQILEYCIDDYKLGILAS